MISSVGSSDSASLLASLQKEMFRKADANNDGTIDSSEIAVMQSNASQSDSGGSNLLAKLDTDEDGAISRAESDAAIAKVFYGIGQDGSSTSPPNPAAGGASSSDDTERFTDLFSKIDTDGNGSVSKEEFVANRPDDMSESDATSMWSSLDSEDTGTLTESQFVSAMKSQAPPQGPPPGPPPGAMAGQEDTDTTSASSTSSTSSTSSASSDLVNALTAAISKYLSATSQSDAFSLDTATALSSLSTIA